MLDKSDRSTFAGFDALWPLKRFPLLFDEGRPVAEATIIIEHLGLHHPDPVRLIPDDPASAPEVRFIDRFFDNYVQTPMQMDRDVPEPETNCPARRKPPNTGDRRQSDRRRPNQSAVQLQH